MNFADLLSDEAYALAQGMLMGDKSALSPEMMKAFRTAGMSHILAVSGLHVGIIMSLMWAAFRPIEWLVLFFAPVRMNTYYILGDIKRILVIVVTFLYVWAIGAPTSAVRAAVMLSLCLLGWMMHRPASVWRCMIMAALMLLAWDPWSIKTPGFQLSFLAVTGILLFRPWLQNFEIPRWLRLILLSVAAQWLTIPVVAYWFHQVPVLGWIQGLLVVPLLPLFVTLLLLVFVFPQASWFVWAVEAMTSWMGFVAQMIGRLENWLLGGHLYFYPTWWEAVLAEIFMLSVILYFRLSRGPMSIEERKEKLRKRLRKKHS